MTTNILIWFVLFYYTLSQTKKTNASGLCLAYLAGFGLIHVPGAFVNLESLDSWRLEQIEKGFYLSTLGAVCFVFGIMFANSLQRKPKKYKNAHSWALPDDNTILLLYSVGLFTKFVLMPIFGQVATLTAILAGVGQLTIAAACIGLWSAKKKGDKRLLVFWLLLAVLEPMFWLVTSAFLGFGVYSLIAVSAFLLNVYKFRLRAIHIPVILLACYLGLSIFVTYFGGRTEYRNLVWYEGVGVGERTAAIADNFLNFEFFDPSDPDHFYAVDGRLNQNYLAGLAASNLENGRFEYAGGETIVFSFVALIPRAIWPDKPAVGGGGGLVSQYTGLTFARSTSVGAGQVLEFYINFGTYGVVIGFFFFGYLLRLFDLNSRQFLQQEEVGYFVLWFLPGLGFLQAGGNLVEITTTVVSSIISAMLVMRLAKRIFRKRIVREVELKAGI